MKTKKIKFAEGLCYDKLFLIFVIMSIAGSFYEQILYLIKTYFETGNIVWVRRTALFYGPFNLIYGFGSVISILLFNKTNIKKIYIIILGALLGGIFEYIMSYLQEVLTGTRSWDYTGYFLNINGRTTIPYMLFWGACVLIIVKYIYPFLSIIIEKVPKYIGKALSLTLSIFIILNMFVTSTALLRNEMREKKIEAYTPLGRFYDRVYPNEYIKEVFPNMKEAKKH